MNLLMLVLKIEVFCVKRIGLIQLWVVFLKSSRHMNTSASFARLLKVASYCHLRATFVKHASLLSGHLKNLRTCDFCLNRMMCTPRCVLQESKLS